MDAVKPMLILLAVVAGIMAQEPVPPKPCCPPDEYEINIGQLIGTVVSGKGVPFTSFVKMASDFTNKRIGLQIITAFDEQIYTYKVISDYTKAVQYVILEQSQFCQQIPLPSTNMSHCIAANATYLGTYYLGDNKITADTFSYYFKEEESQTGQGTISVSKGNCIPLSSTFVGERDGDGIMSVSGFSNFASPISDPASYFDVPAYCPKSFSKKQTLFKGPDIYTKHLYLPFL